MQSYGATFPARVRCPSRGSRCFAWSCRMPYDHAFMIRARIIGASGNTGAELLRLLAGHPSMEVVVATADASAGEAASALYPSLAASFPRLTFESFDLDRIGAAALDVAFLGLPHQASMELVPQLSSHI